MGLDYDLPQDRHALLMQHVVMQIKEQEATTYDEAWNYPNLKIRKKYRDGIHKEFRKMNKSNLWRKTMRQDIPQGKRCVKCRWAFEIKRNGLFRCCLVACGYSQIPGLGFTETFSPVINDITWRVLIIFIIGFSFQVLIIDIEAAFLYGDFEAGEKCSTMPLVGLEDSVL
jgi:hypothetical protein